MTAHPEDEFAWRRAHPTDLFWILCLGMIVIAAACCVVQADEPPPVDTLEVWTRADQETQMFMVGFSWKFNDLLPGRADVAHTAGEVAALVDYYRYPAMSADDHLWAQAADGVSDSPGFQVLPPPDQRGIDETKGLGVTGWISDNRWPIIGTLTAAGLYLYGDEIQDAYDGLTGRNEEDKEAERKKAIKGEQPTPTINQRVSVTAEGVNLSSATNVSSIEVVAGESGSGTARVTFFGEESSE